MNIDEFKCEYLSKNQNKSLRSLLTNTYIKKNTDDSICVYFAENNTDTTTFGKESFTNFLFYLDNEAKTTNGIIITEKPLSPNVKKSILNLPAYNIQVFLDRELVYNPTKHFMVPEHYILSEIEVNNLLNNNQGLKLEQLPVILPNDPVVKFLGGKLEQVVRIKRYVILNNMLMYNVKNVG